MGRRARERLGTKAVLVGKEQRVIFQIFGNDLIRSSYQLDVADEEEGRD